MVYKTDYDTYQKLVHCLDELNFDIKVDLITTDPMLKELGFVDYIPCTIDIMAKKEEIQKIKDFATDCEIAAYNDEIIGNDNKHVWEEYEKYGWLFDFFQ